jgi:2-acylglycerol O-acyltransferase 2
MATIIRTAVFTPWQRRLQTIGVLWWFITLFPLSVYVWVGFLFTVLLLNPVTLPLLLLYLGWCYYDRHTPARGGRPLRWLQRLPIWQLFLDFFPMSLHRTDEAVQFDPHTPYLFGFHPHGVLTLSAINFLVTPQLRPGFDDLRRLSVRLMTLSMNFWVPFWREYIMGLGICSVSARSIQYNLQHGHSVLIVVGGAAESLEAHPGTMNLVLARRKGFVREAIRNGASMVPIVSFGENDLFDQVPNPPDSGLRRFQERVKSLFGFSPPLFHGRGVFNYNFGLLPFRRPIHTIIGHPIPCPKIENPTPEQVDEFHQRYINELSSLYHQHKEKFAPHRVSELRLLD